MDEIRVEISTLKIPYEHSLVPIYPDLTFNKDDACFLFETLSSFAFLIYKFFLLSGYTFSCIDSRSPSTGVPATWAVASISLFCLEKLHHPRMFVLISPDLFCYLTFFPFCYFDSSLHIFCVLPDLE